MIKESLPVEEAYRLINPGCVVLLTSAYRDRQNVMALAWHTPLSRRPPLVGIAVAQKHFTAELISASEEFALNIPGADLLEQVLFCGRVCGREKDKFKEARITPETAKKIRAPLVAQCAGYLECGVVDRHKVGDHYLFVGEVLAAGAAPALFSGQWKESAELLHHLGGKLFYTGGRRLESD
ncbi:MAG: flavin reductase family protein [Desulfotomaculales bacterium]